MTVLESKAAAYARWCIDKDNGMVGGYIKKQAAAWLNIAEGRDSGAYVDEERFKRLYDTMGYLVHPDLGCPMDEGLEDYAHFLITAALCTIEAGTGRRYYTNVVLEIARKNFKTFNSGVIFILLMLTEPDFSRFFSVAPDLKLSKELQFAMRKIIKSSPALSDESDLIFQTMRSEIRCHLTNSDYTPLAYSRDKMDGKLANAFLADEAGAMDTYPVEAMRSSQITLPNKLGIVISTQYPNDDNAMIDEIDRAKKTLDGLLADSRTFALLYEPDNELLLNDGWQTDDLIIYQANPAAVNNELIFSSIKEIRERAILYPNSAENFLCKHCNIKYKGLGVEGYIDVMKVRECSRDEDLEFWQGRLVFIGFDLSMSEDNTSVAMVTIDEDVIYAKVWGFIPAGKKAAKREKEAVDYDVLIRRGVCFECGDDVIDYGFIETFILGLQCKYGIKILQIGFDKWNAMSSAQKLEAAGYEMVEITQHSRELHSPTKLLMEKILSRKFVYDANLMLEINFQNARCTFDTNMNRYVNKKRSDGKVDMVVSLINAVYLLEQSELYGRGEIVTFVF